MYQSSLSLAAFAHPNPSTSSISNTQTHSANRALPTFSHTGITPFNQPQSPHPAFIHRGASESLRHPTATSFSQLLGASRTPAQPQLSSNIVRLAHPQGQEPEPLSPSGQQQTPEQLQAELDKPAAQFYRESGVYPAEGEPPKHLVLFTQQSDEAMDNVRALVDKGEMSLAKGVEFQSLLKTVGSKIINHPIVANNQYLERFSQGGLTKAQARHELQQFSVFAFQFNAAQAQLIANAETQDEWHERTKILANEMGAPYTKGFEGELSGKWDIKHNHHIWLLNMGKALDLEFSDMGKMRIANEGSRAFVESIFKYYTDTNPNISSGATFGIENWAANNLWKPWIEGMEKYNADQPKGERVNLGYIKYHDMEERHHSQATITELLANFQEEWFEPDTFIDTAVKMLDDGVQAYYEAQLATLPEKDASWPEKAC